MGERSKGYPPGIFGGELNPKYLCGSCRFVLRDPLQRYCGHRYCKKCVELNKSLEENCPPCVEEGTIEESAEDEPPDSKQMFPDMAVRREMARIIVGCTVCDWRGSFKDFMEHNQQHESVVGNCPVDCGIQLVQGDDIDGHIREHLVAHMDLTYARIRTVEEKIQSSSTFDGSRLSQLDRNVQNLEKQMSELSVDDVTQIQSKRSTVATSVANVAGAVKQVDVAVVDKMLGLEDKITALNNLTDVATSRCAESDKLHQEERNMIEKVDRALRVTELAASSKDSLLDQLTKGLSNLEATSYDGTLVWPITEVSKKRQEAISEQKTSIYSVPFYTSPTGYKMCLRVYLNGDGLGKNTHLSVFFVVMRGNYDVLQRWPFQQKITLMLLNQNNRDNVVDAFRPDASSSSFRRPTGDMNVASGCPLFAPLVDIDNPATGFVKEDRMFLKVIVDVAGLR